MIQLLAFKSSRVARKTATVDIKWGLDLHAYHEHVRKYGNSTISGSPMLVYSSWYCNQRKKDKPVLRFDAWWKLWELVWEDRHLYKLDNCKLVGK